MSYDKSAEDKVQSEAHNSSSLFQVGTEETLHEIVLTNRAHKSYIRVYHEKNWTVPLVRCDWC